MREKISEGCTHRQSDLSLDIPTASSSGFDSKDGRKGEIIDNRAHESGSKLVIDVDRIVGSIENLEILEDKVANRSLEYQKDVTDSNQSLFLGPIDIPWDESHDKIDDEKEFLEGINSSNRDLQKTSPSSHHPVDLKYFIYNHTSTIYNHHRSNINWKQYGIHRHNQISIVKVKREQPLSSDLLLQYERAYPTFFHIPKTGGTSIEESLQKSGINIGMYVGKGTINRGFPIDLKNPKYWECVKLNPWHIPPNQHVPKSITIMRDPFDRLLSEWCWFMRMENYIKRFNVSCSSFNKYVESRLILVERGDIGVDGCHWIPQWSFAKHADM